MDKKDLLQVAELYDMYRSNAINAYDRNEQERTFTDWVERNVCRCGAMYSSCLDDGVCAICGGKVLW